MTESVVLELMIWLVAMPLAIGFMTALRRCRAAKLNPLRTSQTLDHRDRFEIADAIFGAAAFFCPMALGFAFYIAKIDLPAWQWWATLMAIGVIGAIPMMIHGRWSRAQRQRLELGNDKH